MTFRDSLILCVLLLLVAVALLVVPPTANPDDLQAQSVPLPRDQLSTPLPANRVNPSADPSADGRAIAHDPVTVASDYMTVAVFDPARGIRPRRVSRAAFEARERDYLAVVEKDIAAGLNAETRAKEDQIMWLAEGVKKGMPLEEVLAILGQPDRVDRIKTEPVAFPGAVGISFEVSYVPSLKEVPPGQQICASYWPRAGVPFDGRNGQGYKVLYLVFDTERKFESKIWQQPEPLYMGELGDLQRQSNYWRGAHTISPPPTEEFSTRPVF